MNNADVLFWEQVETNLISWLYSELGYFLSEPWLWANISHFLASSFTVIQDEDFAVDI